LALVLGCALPGGGCVSTTSIRAIRVSTTDDVNQKMAVAVDIVVLYSKAILEKLPTQSPAWFEQRSSLRAEHSFDMDVIELEIPPGVEALNLALPARFYAATNVVMYANYINKNGQSRQDLTGLECANVALGPKGVKLSNTTPTLELGPCRIEVSDERKSR
jgi:hypothetical protein